MFLTICSVSKSTTPCPFLRAHTQPEVVARHTTEYNIKAVRFSEFDEDQVVTCGRDSVRVYRLKDQQLRGVSVRLGPPDRKVRV